MFQPGRRRPLLALPLVALFACSSPGGGPNEILETGQAAVRESDLRAALSARGVSVELPIQKRGVGRLRGQLTMQLVDLSKTPEAVQPAVVVDVDQSEDRRAYTAVLGGLGPALDRTGAVSIIIAWSADLNGTQLRGRTSLYSALGALELQLRGATDIPRAGGAPFRMIVRDPLTLELVSGADVAGRWLVEGAEPVDAFAGKTDARGELEVNVNLPASLSEATLRVEVNANGRSTWTTTPVKAVTPQRLALSTDKTIYKPGQTIHVRLLALGADDKRPVEGRPIALEVLDAKGNKIIKRTLTTDTYGVASTALATASEVNEGTWTLRADLEGTRVERKLPVAAYVLPKLNVAVSVPQGYAVPGAVASGTVEARYVFGAPVTSASAVIRAVVGEQQVGTASVQTDDQGVARFSMQLPAGFGGEAVADGTARISFEAELTDSAGQRQVGRTVVPLAPGPLVLQVIDEASTIVAGAENRLWIVLRDPAGRPISGTIESSVDGANRTLTTDASGVAELRFTPAAGAESVSITLNARDGAGRTQSRTLTRAPAPGGLLVRAERARYAAGEKARIELVSATGGQRVHLDAYVGGRAVSGAEITLDASGRASAELELTAAHRGLVVLDALALAAPGQVVRGSTRMLVDPEDALDIRLEPGRATYAPGDEARVRVRVRDAAGAPKVAALGLTAVDEAVFQLGGEPNDALRSIFSLDPRVLPNGVGADAVLSAADGELRRLLAGPAPLSGVEYNSVRAERPAIQQRLAARVKADLVGFLKLVAPLLRDREIDQALADSTVLPAARRLPDPFGQPYQASLAASPEVLRITSLGPDERPNTGDEVTAELWYGWARWTDGDSVNNDGLPTRGGGVEAAFDGAAGPPQAAGGPDPAPAPQAPGKSAGSETKVRSDFRETILVQPMLVTDANGDATLTFPLADSITTWRVTAHGSTRDGHLGTSRLGFRTYQDFFVDLTLPVALTRGDEIELPAVVYNYLSTPTTVRVTLEQAPWFTLVSAAEQQVSMGPSEVRAVKFRLRANRAGLQQLSLRAEAGGVRDALVREIKVAPGGTREDVAFSDRLIDSRTHSIDVPASAIEGSVRVQVALTPGFGGEAVAGTEGLLQEPHGCFEQTTSTAWPNTLVTQYLVTTNQLTPELSAKATDLVSKGYQRLLTFESPTGGFNWWGDSDPGNRILSAIMLWHLKDMEGIIETDPAVRDRTLRWLIAQQAGDGSWPSGDALHSGNEVLGTSVARTTAFIAWALAHTGWADDSVAKAANYLRGNLPDASDLYANALAANALGIADPSGGATNTLFARLDTAKVVGEEGRIKWPTEAPSWTGASGDSAAIETTGLVAYGLIKSRSFPGNAAGAVKFLVANKDAVGSWYNTQATMNALRALLAAASPQGSEAEGTLTVTVNGTALPAVTVTRADGDVYRTIDLGDAVRPGTNEVRLEFRGTGEVAYNLSRRVHLPTPPRAPTPELALNVVPRSTDLRIGETTRLDVQASFRGAGSRDQVVVRVGLAPGLVPATESLTALVQSRAVSRFELTGTDVVLYLMDLKQFESRALSFDVVPTLAGELTTTRSSIYAYYEASIRTELAPQTFRVTGN